jgi:hypothetical protein
MLAAFMKRLDRERKAEIGARLLKLLQYSTLSSGSSAKSGENLPVSSTVG